MKPRQSDKHLVKEAERRANEQVIEEAQRVDEAKRSEKRLAQEHEQLAREQERKKAFLTKEQAIVEAQEARKLKAKKQSPE